MKRLHLALSLTIAVTMLSLTFQAASAAEETATMSVTVNTQKIIDLFPESASWTGDPGNATAPLWTNFTLENVGSDDITNVYANVTQPNSDPFGSGSNTDAGNLIAIRNDSSEITQFVDRREYNLSLPDYVTTNAACDNNTGGRLHMDNEEFFWCAASLAGGGNSGTYEDGELYIGDSAHNHTDIGDIDLTDNGANSLTSIQSGEYGAAEVTITTDYGDETYCAAIKEDGSYLRLTRWNNDLQDGTTCTDFTLNGGTTLNPGDSITMGIRARIPFGLTGADSGTLKIIGN